MEDNYINELDKEFKKSRWLRGGPGGKENREMREVRDMSGSSHSSDSHGVYSAYSNIGEGGFLYDFKKINIHFFQGRPLFSHPFLVKTQVIISKWRAVGII